MAEIEDTKGVLSLFADASREGFWGKLEFSFQEGRLKMIRKEATFKVNDLDFSEIAGQANSSRGTQELITVEFDPVMKKGAFVKKICAWLCILMFALIVADSAVFAGEKKGKGKVAGVIERPEIYEGRAEWGDFVVAVHPSVLKHYKIKEIKVWGTPSYRRGSARMLATFSFSVFMEAKTSIEEKIKAHFYELNSITGSKKKLDLVNGWTGLNDSYLSMTTDGKGTTIGASMTLSSWDIVELECE